MKKSFVVAKEFHELLLTSSVSSPLATLPQWFHAHPEVVALQARLGHQWRNPAHLLIASTHRSFAHMVQSLNLDFPFCEDNERYEFLGDSLLNLLLAQTLFGLREKLSEGALSFARAHFASKAFLLPWAHDLGLERILLVGKGESRRDDGDSILADAMEALLAAQYLDLNSDFNALAQFWRQSLMEKVQDFEVAKIKDAKMALQELLTKQGKSASYVCHDNNPPFTVTLMIDQQAMGVARGLNKKKIEKELAQQTLPIFERRENDAHHAPTSP